MKLIQYRIKDDRSKDKGPCVGLVREETVTHLFHGNMVNFIQGVFLDGGIGKIRSQNKGNEIPLSDISLLAPITRPSKIMAVGLNYAEHEEESKGAFTNGPVIFSKFPSSIIGPYETVVWNGEITDKVDYEAELAVVIGKQTKDCPRERAFDVIFGYTCANDITARDLQFKDKQWTRGKSLDTFCPLGPWIVTRDEIPNPNSLDIRSSLNDMIVQESNTCHMIFDVPHLVSIMSRYFTLMPGDIILTGTPPGVGAFRTPPLYLKNGDEIQVEIEAIGRLINTCLVR